MFLKALFIDFLLLLAVFSITIKASAKDPNELKGVMNVIRERIHWFDAAEDPFHGIIGGGNAKSSEFPWQASFRKLGIHLCGAVIIKEQWVLTAAHCTEGWSTNAITITAGRLSKLEAEPNEQDVPVEAFYQHENYNSESNENDISLLKLQKKLTFNSFVNAARLPLKKQQLFSGNCDITGWGFITPDGGFPNLLQKVSIPLISDDECQDRMGQHEVTESMICTWAEGKDACEGDSGGPMMCTGEDGKSYLAGITSWGLNCADHISPGVYTEVSYFLDWITETIEKHS
uniref:Serine protease n=1 Tax=Hemiscolopendra marginata TaxID=943146 RepID=A0A646QGP2_9MYRI